MKQKNKIQKLICKRIRSEDAGVRLYRRIPCVLFVCTLHQHPKLSYEEKNTTAYLVPSLKELGITAAHHHPAFDVDEDVLFHGTGIYVQFVLDYLNA